jgi:transcriptional regulator with XRE-family HTH domain
MGFSEQLLHYRSKLGLTQAEMARLLEISPRTYWNWEERKTTTMPVARDGALYRIARAVKSGRQPQLQQS